MQEILKNRFKKIMPLVDFCALRYVENQTESLNVRKNICQPVYYEEDVGIMITIIDKGGLGYAATSDLSESGLREAVSRAQQWAMRSRGNVVADFFQLKMSHAQGEYQTPVQQPWNDWSLQEKLDFLLKQSHSLSIDDRIVDWGASLEAIHSNVYYITNLEGEIYQDFNYIIPNLYALAHQGLETQERSLRHGYGRQGGLEILQHIHFEELATQLAEESLQLLSAPNCPNDKTTLMLMPDQMMLQIHESIGHPLELDRILGDERNYAGTSFVTLDMFGQYVYGSELLNISFDPTPQAELASYRFDDEGNVAEKTLLIEKGILRRPLGGHISQQRANIAGVANSRACNWNRPPIDRMANLNLEPGDKSFQEMLSQIEKGVLMKTNNSWSIDDSRNKFQFGCEWGQLIENGELTQVVKNPNYRGISATFWRNLNMVGNAQTMEMLGVNLCGKGEPSQAIHVGHASPACVFTEVEVFGGV